MLWNEDIRETVNLVFSDARLKYKKKHNWSHNNVFIASIEQTH